MAQELLSVIQSIQRGGLFLGRAREHQADMRMAKIGRKMNLGDAHRPDPRVGHFIGDQLLKLFPNALGDSFCAVRIQIPEYRSGVELIRSKSFMPEQHIRRPGTLRKSKPTAPYGRGSLYGSGLTSRDQSKRWVQKSSRCRATSPSSNPFRPRKPGPALRLPESPDTESK